MSNKRIPVIGQTQKEYRAVRDNPVSTKGGNKDEQKAGCSYVLTVEEYLTFMTTKIAHDSYLKMTRK